MKCGINDQSSGCVAYNRVRLLLRFKLYKNPKSGGAASIWRSAYTRHNTVYEHSWFQVLSHGVPKALTRPEKVGT